MLVLVVDDNDDLAEMLTTMLELAGHTVSAVTENFAGLLHPAPWLGVDGALVDLRLSEEGISGADVVEAGFRFCPSARLVVLTGTPEGDDGDLRRASQWATAVLRKPASIALMLAALAG